ncbi:unnamed protein product, partial [Urochloa humidicola]
KTPDGLQLLPFRRLVRLRGPLVLPGETTKNPAVVRLAAGRRRRRGIRCTVGDSFRARAPVPATMSRQSRKEAAAAAQNLLKMDAARMRKAAAAQSRKDAAAQMRKAQGRIRVPLMLEQSSSGWVAPVPKQRSSRYSTATPPKSFTDGACFFNGSAGSFFDSAGQSFFDKRCC